MNITNLSIRETYLDTIEIPKPEINLCNIFYIEVFIKGLVLIFLCILIINLMFSFGKYYNKQFLLIHALSFVILICTIFLLAYVIENFFVAIFILPIMVINIVSIIKNSGIK